MSGIIEPAALARLAAVRERRFGNRKSVCPYKRPYNSGTRRIRVLSSPSVLAGLTRKTSGWGLSGSVVSGVFSDS